MLGEKGSFDVAFQNQPDEVMRLRLANASVNATECRLATISLTANVDVIESH